MNRGLLVTQLIVDENNKLHPYPDTDGNLTIGVGRNLTTRGITPTESLYLLSNDIDVAIHDLNTAVPWWTDISEQRQNVLVNMCFNMGIARLMGFKKMLAAAKAGLYATAAAEMLNSDWARQVGDRAIRLANVMRGTS